MCVTALFNSHGQFVLGAFCFSAGFLKGIGRSEDNAHTAMAFDFGLAEDADLGSGFLEDFVEILENYLFGISFHHDRTGSRRTIETDFRNRKTEQSAGVETELTASECVGNLAGNLPCLGNSLFAHGLRLPRLAVVAVDLDVSDGFAESGSGEGTDGQQGDFIVEFHKAFHNNTAGSGASPFLSLFPGRFDIGGALDRGLKGTRLLQQPFQIPRGY